MHRKSSVTPLYLKPLLATIVVPGLLLSLLFTGCAKDPIKEADDKFLSKGDVIGAVQFLKNVAVERGNYNKSARIMAKAKLKELYPAYYIREAEEKFLLKGDVVGTVQFLENITTTYNESVRTAAKAKLEELYPTYYLKLAPKNFSDAESLLAQEKYKEAIKLYQLIPETADEYQKAQKKVSIAQKKLDEIRIRKERIERIEGLIGDWEGELYTWMLLWKHTDSYIVRIIDSSNLKYVTSTSKLFGRNESAQYSFDSRPLSFKKKITDDFGDTKGIEKITAYKFNVKIGIDDFRYVVFESKNKMTLHNDIPNNSTVRLVFTKK